MWVRVIVVHSALFPEGSYLGFTRTGQEMLTSEIRRELMNLQGFRFSFRGNREFGPARVQALENMVDRQIQAILKGEILYTRDVFIPGEIPRESAQEGDPFDNADELRAAAALAAKLKETGCFSSVMEEIGEDNHVIVIATLYEKGDFINLNIRMDGMEIFCDKNGIETGTDELCRGFQAFPEAYGSP